VVARVISTPGHSMSVEVLAPAGSKEAFKAALAGGADAVYLGGRLFGARRFAPNFTDAELKCAVKLAHSKGVKVYATVNTLIKESELPLARDYLGLLDLIKVDAVIVQDRGLVRLIKESFGLDVHASTQMGIHSPDDAQWAEGMGISRAILARELSLDEVKAVRESSEIGIEVFVHGALCYGFSGQCLFSSVLGGRSATAACAHNPAASGTPWVGSPGSCSRPRTCSRSTRSPSSSRYEWTRSRSRVACAPPLTSTWQRGHIKPR
jgi:putative protease